MSKLGPYYINFTNSIGEDFSEYEFSEQGIPLVRFSMAVDWHHNPVTVCQYALAQYNRFLASGSLQAKENFLIQANWLLMNYESGPYDSAVWYYRLNIPFYGLRKPWISGMAQGEALSVLLRAYQVSKEENFLFVAEKAWKIFDVPVQDGGIISTFPDGAIAIEEYPSNPKSNVLNGFIFALFGIYDFRLMSKNGHADILFNDCIQSLKKNLIHYDTTYWSLYDLMKPPRLTSRAYHRLHIALLRGLSQVTHDKSFLKISNRWEKYVKDPVCNLKWFMHKIRQRSSTCID